MAPSFFACRHQLGEAANGLRLTLLNAAILLLSLAVSGWSLWAASHAELWVALLAVWLFSLVNNTPFSVMHEAVHGVGCRSRRTNALLGIVAGWAFRLVSASACARSLPVPGMCDPTHRRTDASACAARGGRASALILQRSA